MLEQSVSSTVTTVITVNNKLTLSTAKKRVVNHYFNEGMTMQGLIEFFEYLYPNDTAAIKEHLKGLFNHKF